MLPIKEWYTHYWGWSVFRGEDVVRMVVVYRGMGGPSSGEWMVPGFETTLEETGTVVPDDGFGAIFVE
jgi:hypothetical protein